ncbi:tensin-1-like [Scaptodrosophila lebanonensis]|uniref:Tensin-1-like n=1 Tax=Drosophila lebanonensis TaxID=7225 RepID=A0A6J2T9G5_DROLE|nr:tensin-1-like [Scaptodrosophila lebanonensis]
MAPMYMHQSVSIDVTDRSPREENTKNFEDLENIPYHVREDALPFTYGNLPSGFSTSKLNHVDLEENKLKHMRCNYSPSPSTVRKFTRPSIVQSSPVLRKTPSRQEFEEMLMERKELALREQNNVATKLAQKAAIQKDLDVLHEKLNKTLLCSENEKICQLSELQVFDQAGNVPVIKFVDLANTPSSVERVANGNNLTGTNRSITPTLPAPPNASSSSHCAPISPHADWSCPTQEVEPHLVNFAKNSSQYWYKPKVSRREAVDLLHNAPPGTFIIRNSTTYQNAFGLVLRVDKPPPGVAISSENGDELVRHFLLEPTTRGVHLKGCTNEPIFTSLSAFVYQHSINQLALPCTLRIPDRNLYITSAHDDLSVNQKQSLGHGCTCNALYLFQCNMESLTGKEAVRKAVYEMYGQLDRVFPIELALKLDQEITSAMYFVIWLSIIQRLPLLPWLTTFCL